MKVLLSTVIIVLISSPVGLSSEPAPYSTAPLVSDQHPDVAEFSAIGDELSEAIEAHGEALPAGVSLQALQRSLRFTPIQLADCDTHVCAMRFPGPEGETLIRNSAACGERTPARITLCRQSWHTASRTQKQELVLHAHLSIVSDLMDFRFRDSRAILAALAEAPNHETSDSGATSPTDDRVFPLVGRGGAVERAFQLPSRSPDHTSSSFIRNFSLGVGASLNIPNSGNARAYPSIQGSASYRYFARSNLPGPAVGDLDALSPEDLENRVGATMVPGFDTRLRFLVMPSDDRPLYRFRFDASAGPRFIGIWAVVEKNRLQEIDESILRGMVMVHLEFIRKGTTYALFKLGAGVHTGRNPIDPILGDRERINVSNGATVGASLIVRAADFFIEIDGDLDARQYERQGAGNRGWRHTVDAGIGYVLGALFPSDEIRLQVRHTGYEGITTWYHFNFDVHEARFPSFAETTIGAYYQARFGN